jgi:hypothetical protein
MSPYVSKKTSHTNKMIKLKALSLKAKMSHKFYFMSRSMLDGHDSFMYQCILCYRNICYILWE